MFLNELIKLITKKGFSNTLQILTKSKNYKTKLPVFYKELNKFSYYNSFLRIKDRLINKGIINIKTQNGKKSIILTKKGIAIYKKLVEIKTLLY